MEQPNCVFCRIAQAKEQASIVYENDAVIAFLDTFPINTGHTLVIPRRHATYLADLDPAAGACMFTAAQRVAAALRASKLPCQAVNLLLNDGAEAGQRVFHSHMHVIPRVLGDSLVRNLDAWMPTRQDLDEVAAELRRVIEAAS